MALPDIGRDALRIALDRLYRAALDFRESDPDMPSSAAAEAEFDEAIEQAALTLGLVRP